MSYFSDMSKEVSKLINNNEELDVLTVDITPGETRIHVTLKSFMVFINGKSMSVARRDCEQYPCMVFVIISGVKIFALTEKDIFKILEE